MQSLAAYNASPVHPPLPYHVIRVTGAAAVGRPILGDRVGSFAPERAAVKYCRDRQEAADTAGRAEQYAVVNSRGFGLWVPLALVFGSESRVRGGVRRGYAAAN